MTLKRTVAAIICDLAISALTEGCRAIYDNGGRLFGGFWQRMSKAERLMHIKGNGEDVVELDYGLIMPRLVYAFAGRVRTNLQRKFAG